MVTRIIVRLVAVRVGVVVALGSLMLALPGQSRSGSVLTAAFAARTFTPGQMARLAIDGARPTSIRIFHAGYGRDGVMQGQPVSATIKGGRVLIGDWPSGLYYARVVAGRDTTDAPFVLRPRRLGEHRVLVVLPTNTWQAYNFEAGDSWYLNPGVRTVDLSRPFIDNGVPPHYHGYDRGFIRWLALTGKHPDFVSDDDLEYLSGDRLAHLYNLIVFSGHEEYVTPHAYSAVERYRDLGGNLAFLSANNFFYRVLLRGQTITRSGRWRDLGRPEVKLIGSDYVGWNRDTYPNRPYDVVDEKAAPWLFRGTGFRDGARFGRYGIEIDGKSPASPPGTEVLAEIPNDFGPGKSADMTYYTTRRGAKVFAAGVMNFGGSALWPGVRQMMDNLWAELSRP